MVRGKVNIKRIESSSRSQVTFSKRRNGLLKKAHEISVLCGVDVALIAFSNTGRLSQFSSQKRIEDLIVRYIINHPSKQRNYLIENPQKLLERYNHIKGDRNKALFVENQIQRVREQIKAVKIELHFVESELRNYDPDPKEITSVAEALWREKTLEKALKFVLERKEILTSNSFSWFQSQQIQIPIQQMEMFPNRRAGRPSWVSLNPEEAKWVGRQPTANQVVMQMDPWLGNQRFPKPVDHNQLNRSTGLVHNGNALLNNANSPPIANFLSLNRLRTSSVQPLPQIPQPFPPMQQSVAPMLPDQQFGTLGNSPMFKEPSLNWQQGVQPTSDSEQVNWFPNAPPKYGHNFNVSQPFHPSRNLSPYDPIYEGMGLHVDPILRTYYKNNHNDNLEDANGPNSQPQKKDDKPSENPALPLSNPLEDPVNLDDLLIEGMMSDDILLLNTEYEAESNDELFLSEKLLNLDDFDSLFDD